MERAYPEISRGRKYLWACWYDTAIVELSRKSRRESAQQGR
jgi:hypothetical protein